jgi:hypothetical protein
MVPEMDGLVRVHFSFINSARCLNQIFFSVTTPSLVRFAPSLMYIATLPKVRIASLVSFHYAPNLAHSKTMPSDFIPQPQADLLK